MSKFDDLAAFAAVVRAGSFTRAAAQLGMTQSALSQTVKGLERRLDMKLLNRTTRSLAATEAGEKLYQTVGPRLADIEAELAVLREMRGKPAGSIRITATEHAARTLVWPRLADWLPGYPDINIEIISDNRFVDIVAERFDIGVRLGGDIAKDMIAVRIAPDMRMSVVASPSYLAKHGRPASPQNLTEHDCIRQRLPTHGTLMNWEFRRRGKNVNAQVAGRLIFNGSGLSVEAAVSGLGLLWVPEDVVAEQIAAGQLVTLLEDWAITYPGYHLYYASRRASPAVSLVVEALRQGYP
jgi:DNA-binding transcriptional LysR family regulator